MTKSAVSYMNYMKLFSKRFQTAHFEEVPTTFRVQKAALCVLRLRAR